MILSELMAGKTLNPAFAGIVTNDDMVLAVNTGTDSSTDPNDYAVVQGAIAGVDAQLNPTTEDKTYIRAGLSTSKTGTQRTFSVSGDRFIGDVAQDYIFGLKYKTGADVVTDYVYFCIKNGVGEKGQIAVIVNSDGSGDAGNTAEIDVELHKFNAAPTLYTYAPAGA